MGRKIIISVRIISMFLLFYLVVIQDERVLAQNSEPNLVLVIHGGAGTIKKSNLTPELEQAYLEKLAEALESGFQELINGGKAMEAVIIAIKIMEDSPLFNAGKGAVFTHEGKNEMDAAVMDGQSLKAGAVAGLSLVKNPIEAAYRVMNNTDHVLLAGKAADEFCRQSGLIIVDPSYFYTEHRYKSLLREKELEKKKGDTLWPENKSGTVGAVALDRFGNLAAGTSTGGMTNKKFGRIGDSPIIGAGTYADNLTCAISATGHGEFFIRKVIAYDIVAKMKYLEIPLEEAVRRTIMEELTALGGTGGVIALDGQGNIAMVFNTEGMYRGYIKTNQKPHIFIYKE